MDGQSLGIPRNVLSQMVAWFLKYKLSRTADLYIHHENDVLALPLGTERKLPQANRCRRLQSRSKDQVVYAKEPKLCPMNKLVVAVLLAVLKQTAN